MKTKIFWACVLFAVSMILEGIAGKIMPFDEIIQKALNKA